MTLILRPPARIAVFSNTCPENSTDLDGLIKAADDAMYAGKGATKNRVTVSRVLPAPAPAPLSVRRMTIFGHDKAVNAGTGSEGSMAAAASHLRRLDNRRLAW